MDNLVLIILAVCATILVATLYVFQKTRAGQLFEGALKLVVHHSASQGLNYLIGVCLVAGACFTAFYDNFGPIDKSQWDGLGWWQLIALFSKSLAAAPAALVGFLLRSPLSSSNNLPEPVPAKPKNPTHENENPAVSI